MTTSQNGYSAPIDPVRYDLPGGAVSLRAGPTGALLQWVGRQFHARVEALVWPGCWGYNYREIRGATQLSNHASGTALDLNAPAHPLGTEPAENFSAAEIAAIHAIVARTEGCVRWGGDYTGRKDGMHFEINNGVTEAQCDHVLKKLTSGEDDDMQLSDKVNMWRGAAKPQYTVEECLASSVGWGEELGKRLAAVNAGLLAALAASTKDPGITEARMEEIVNNAIEQHVQITGTIEIGPKP